MELVDLRGELVGLSLGFFHWFQLCYAPFKSRFKVQMLNGLMWLIWGCLMGSIVLRWIFVGLFRFVNKFTSHVLLFQDAFTYQHAIALCYNWQTASLQSHILFPRTSAVCEVVVKVLSSIMTGCVLNQSRRHWLLGDALQFIIIKIHEVRDEIGHVVNLNGMGLATPISCVGLL